MTMMYPFGEKEITPMSEIKKKIAVMWTLKLGIQGRMSVCCLDGVKHEQTLAPHLDTVKNMYGRTNSQLWRELQKFTAEESKWSVRDFIGEHSGYDRSLGQD